MIGQVNQLELYGCNFCSTLSVWYEAIWKCLSTISVPLKRRSGIQNIRYPAKGKNKKRCTLWKTLNKVRPSKKAAYGFEIN